MTVALGNAARAHHINGPRGLVGEREQPGFRASLHQHLTDDLGELADRGKIGPRQAASAWQE
jgi:hypothetical protein